MWTRYSLFQKGSLSTPEAHHYFIYLSLLFYRIYFILLFMIEYPSHHLFVSAVHQRPGPITGSILAQTTHQHAVPPVTLLHVEVWPPGMLYCGQLACPALSEDVCSPNNFANCIKFVLHPSPNILAGCQAVGNLLFDFSSCRIVWAMFPASLRTCDLEKKNRRGR